MKDELAKNICRYCKEKGFTQEELANKRENVSSRF